MTTATLPPEPSLAAQAKAGDRFPERVTESRAPRVFGLDFLRAAAICMVFIVHSLAVLMPYLPWWVGFVGHGGFYGVELFFVLSGYLIGRILVRESAQMGTATGVGVFYVRRWFRTLPLFILCLLLQVLVEFIIQHRWIPAAIVAEHGLFLRNLTGNHLTFFGESWSLAVEEWFYLLFPAALWVALKVSRRFDRALLFCAAGFCLFSLVARMISAPHLYATWTEWQRRVVIFRFDSLMLGVVAAWVSIRYAERWRRAAIASAIVGMVGLILLYASLWKVSGHVLGPSPDDYFARTFRFTLVSVGFALLLPVASVWRVSRDNFVTLAIRAIALWSYAIYLIHVPVVRVMHHFLPKTWEASPLRATGYFLAEVTIVGAASALLYRFYESRCTHLRDRVVPMIRRLGS